MIGPGTGVAPFHGFVQERAEQTRGAVDVGKAMLFFGCRRPDEDFIYQSEWKVSYHHTPSDLYRLLSNYLYPQGYQEALRNKFDLITAFSRQRSEKVYVQHRLKEHSRQVGKLLRQGAFVYVCGDALEMARELSFALARIIAESHGADETKAQEILKTMKSTNRYQVRVIPFGCIRGSLLTTATGRCMDMNRVKLVIDYYVDLWIYCLQLKEPNYSTGYGREA